MLPVSGVGLDRTSEVGGEHSFLASRFFNTHQPTLLLKAEQDFKTNTFFFCISAVNSFVKDSYFSASKVKFHYGDF